MTIHEALDEYTDAILDGSSANRTRNAREALGDSIVTRRDAINTRYRFIGTQSLYWPGRASVYQTILRRVEWDADEAEWVYPEGSINFVAPDKWELVRAANR